MAGDDDLKQHANSSQDFYELLGVSQGSSESEIRRAYRKTALKYHPDKVGANQDALDKFHLLQIAYDVLSNPTVKELYDNARRAREAKKERESAFEGRRKTLKEELEAREKGDLKRKRDEVDAEELLNREIARLAEDGRRRRNEKLEELRREAEEDEKAEEPSKPPETSAVSEIDQAVTLRFAKTAETASLDRDGLKNLFTKFGPVEDVVLRDKKIKLEGEKHRKDYCMVAIVFKSVVGAHAAVSDFEMTLNADSDYQLFEAVGWASGHEPDFIPRSQSDHTEIPQTPTSKPSRPFVPGSAPTLRTQPLAQSNLKKVPSFSSFKAGGKDLGSPSINDLTIIRLKNAEKKRLEEKIRREEAAAAVGLEST